MGIEISSCFATWSIRVVLIFFTPWPGFTKYFIFSDDDAIVHNITTTLPCSPEIYNHHDSFRHVSSRSIRVFLHFRVCFYCTRVSLCDENTGELQGSLTSHWSSGYSTFKVPVPYFLHDRPWIPQWIKSIYIELDIIFDVIASQLYGHCDVISTRLCRHQQNVNQASQTRRRWIKIVVLIGIYGFIMSCKK